MRTQKIFSSKIFKKQKFKEVQKILLQKTFSMQFKGKTLPLCPFVFPVLAKLNAQSQCGEIILSEVQKKNLF